MSKIDNSILDVITSMKTATHVDVSFGDRDLKASRRPVIELVPDEDATITTNNTTGNTLELPLTVNIVVDREDELRAYEILEQSLKTLNSINPSAGFKVGEKIGPDVNQAVMTQTYDVSTFTLAFPYNLNFLLIGE